MKTLNKIKIKYQDAKDIIIDFLKKDSTNLNVLSVFLRKNAILYQYLFGNLFPKCFSRVNDYGINAKTLFNKYYHSFNLQKNMLGFVKEEQQQQQERQQEQREQKEHEHEQNFDSPLNITTLYDVDNDDNDDKDDDGNDKDNDNENKENIPPEKKQLNQVKTKRKIKNPQEKKEKRKAKKKRLLEQLKENTKKMLKIKGKK